MERASKESEEQEMKLWELVFLVAPIAGMLTTSATDNLYVGLLVILLIATWGILKAKR